MKQLTLEQIQSKIKEIWDKRTAYWAPEWIRDEVMVEDLQGDIAFELFKEMNPED